MNKNLITMINKITNFVGSKNEENREIWVQKVLENIPEGQSILDAGAGEQKYRKFCNHLKYTSQDFCQYDGIGDEKGFQTQNWEYGSIDIVSDILKIPVPDESYHNILCTEVFEHILFPIDVLKEFKRILKPGGKIIITAPFSSMTHFAPYYYYSGYSKYFYMEIFKSLDFKIEEISQNGNYFEFLAQEIRRLPQMTENYSGYKLSLFKKALLLLTLRFLSRASRKNNGSEEVLCFGHHVIVEKL